MTSNSLPIEDDFQHLGCPSQTDILSNSPVNHALVAVAQEIAELLKQTYSVRADSIDRNGTIDFRRSSRRDSVLQQRSLLRLLSFDKQY